MRIDQRGMVWGIACILLFSSAFRATAQTSFQASQGCESDLMAAEAQYRNRAFESAISAATECLNRSPISTEHAVHAYRMLALAHARLNNLRAARGAIVSLLSEDPGYTPDTVNDPPIFVSMVSLVKRDFQLGPSAMPVEAVQPLSSMPLDVVLERAMPAPSPVEQEEPRTPFFQRPGTWLTVGGVLIGSGVRSGDHARGVGVGALGVGAGGRFTGIGIGGLGVAGGDALQGIMVGGFGVGSGQRIDGISVGGIGVGTGGDLRGLAIGGLGIGSGASIRGVAVGGLGVGTGGNVTGVALALLGVGGGRDVTGFTVGGVGVGAGRHLRGLHLGGIGIIAPRLTGVAVGGAIISEQAVGGLVAPLYARIAEGGHLKGMSVSLFNHVKGRQQGLTVGLINVADSLVGVQLGVLNYAGNNPLLLRLLPLLNLHF